MTQEQRPLGYQYSAEIYFELLSNAWIGADVEHLRSNADTMMRFSFSALNMHDALALAERKIGNLEGCGWEVVRFRVTEVRKMTPQDSVMNIDTEHFPKQISIPGTVPAGYPVNTAASRTGEEHLPPRPEEPVHPALAEFNVENARAD